MSSNGTADAANNGTLTTQYIVEYATQPLHIAFALLAIIIALLSITCCMTCHILRFTRQNTKKLQSARIGL